jgi:hypothetical protein
MVVAEQALAIAEATERGELDHAFGKRLGIRDVDPAWHRAITDVLAW